MKLTVGTTPVNRTVNSHNEVADQITIRENKLTLVERLADDLAHEIKNPLHSMVINLEVLKRRISRLEVANADELLRYAGILGSELDRVNRRVDLLLRLARPNSDSDDPTTLPEVLEELRELVELECERHQVSLDLEAPSSFVRTQLPRAATRQMILSLLLRTLDTLGPGGTLRVESDLDDDWMRLSFRALDGDGSPPPTPAPADGAYLAVARALAERLGGNLEAAGGDMLADGPGPEGYILTLPRNGRAAEAAGN